MKYLLREYEPFYTEENAMVLIQASEIFKSNPTSTHNHDFFELALVETGNAIHYINGRHFVLGPGDLMLIRPRDEHCYVAYSQNEFKIYDLRFPLEVFSRINDFLDNSASTLVEPELPVTLKLPDSRLIYFSERLTELHSRIPDKARGISMRMVYCELISELLSHQTLPSSMPIWMNDMMFSLDNVFEPELTVSDLAVRSGISKEHICRSFRKHLGVTPSQYLNVIRIRHAGLLMRRGMTDILRICGECGYNNVSYFYRQFREFYHMSPGEYLKKLKKVGRNND